MPTPTTVTEYIASMPPAARTALKQSMMAKYGKQLMPYRSGAGTLRFDLEERLPLALITRLAKLRVRERRAAAAAKRTRR